LHGLDPPHPNQPTPHPNPTNPIPTLKNQKARKIKKKSQKCFGIIFFSFFFKKLSKKIFQRNIPKKLKKLNQKN
jgi:hypothetical protein